MVNATAGLRPSPRQARISTAFFFLISGFGFATWAARIPAIQLQLRLNEAELGGVLLALPAGLMLTLPVTGALLRRYSSRSVMLVGAVLYNLALALLGFATHTWQLVALLFCFGSSRNLLNISVNAQSVGVQALYPRSIIATFHGIWSVAGFAAAALSSVLLGAKVPTAYHFLLVAVVLTSLALLSFPRSLALPPPPASPSSPRFALPDKALLKFGLVAFCSMACEGTMFDWSGVYFAKVVQAPKGLVTAGFTAYLVAMTSGRFLGDWLINRYGTRPLLQASGVLMSTGLLLAAALPQALPAGLGFALVGLGVSCVVPMVFSMAGRAPALGSGAAIAGVSTVGYLGFLIVPPLVGFVAEAASLRWSLGLVAALGVAVLALVPKLE